jgi:hypothetical protein
VLNIFIRFQVDSALSVVPHQILELKTTVNIHRNRLPDSHRRAARKVRTRYRLDKWPEADSHQSKRLRVNRNHGGDIRDQEIHHGSMLSMVLPAQEHLIHLSAIDLLIIAIYFAMAENLYHALWAWIVCVGSRSW